MVCHFLSHLELLLQLELLQVAPLGQLPPQALDQSRQPAPLALKKIHLLSESLYAQFLILQFSPQQRHLLKRTCFKETRSLALVEAGLVLVVRQL